ncbi:MAG: glycosyltransferase family 2 protein [Puniceicoccaceae bacterium]
MKTSLTIVIPTLNEEVNIRTCLESIGSFASVLVVDSGSSDRTLEVAEECGCKVVNFGWNGSYPKKKNWVLLENLVSTEWILFLDADEYLTDEFKSEVAEVLPKTHCNGFWLTYHNHFMGNRLVHGIPFRKLFLLRNGKGLFQRVDDEGWTSLDMEVHEQLEIDGEVGVIKAPIIHNNYKGFDHFIEKHNEYSTWEAKRFLSGKEHFNPSFRQKVKRAFIDSYFLGPLYFVVNYIFRLGFLDGKAGFIYSAIKANYFFQVKVKIDELRRPNAKVED